MAEVQKLAAILAADVVGFSRLTGADEERTLARLRALRSDLIDRRSPWIPHRRASVPCTTVEVPPDWRSVAASRVTADARSARARPSGQTDGLGRRADREGITGDAKPGRKSCAANSIRLHLRAAP